MKAQPDAAPPQADDAPKQALLWVNRLSRVQQRQKSKNCFAVLPKVWHRWDCETAFEAQVGPRRGRHTRDYLSARRQQRSAARAGTDPPVAASAGLQN